MKMNNDVLQIEKLIEEMSRFSTATLHEAAGQGGFVGAGIHALAPQMKVCGRAFTFRGALHDNLAIYHALSAIQRGDVLVGTVGEGELCGYWGDVMTTAAIGAGVRGLVFDGGVRDTQAIIGSGFPVFCRGVSIQGTLKHVDGELNVPIILGKAIVHPGDLIAADCDGVFVLSPDDAEEVLKKAAERDAKEQDYKERLLSGTSLHDIYHY